MWLLAAAILFGPLGPPQQRTFSDGPVRAAIVLRMAQDLRSSSGPARSFPSVAAGTLTVTVGGRRRTYDLASLFAIHNSRIEFPEHPPDEGCGISRVLSHVRSYLAVQAVLAQKGCAPLASFIDLASGEVVENVVLDHSWDHRFDLHPSAFAGESLRVTSAERVVLQGAAFAGPQATVQFAPWPFVIVHTLTAGGEPHAIAYCTACSYPEPAAGSEKLPTVGSRIRVGNFANPSDHFVMLMSDTERVVLLSPADDARYDALQTPTPEAAVRAVIRGHWVEAAGTAAFAGRFLEAVAAEAKVLEYEDDANLYASEATDLRRCRVLAAQVRAGRMTSKAAGALFDRGCVVPKIQP